MQAYANVDGVPIAMRLMDEKMKVALINDIHTWTYQNSGLFSLTEKKKPFENMHEIELHIQNSRAGQKCRTAKILRLINSIISPNNDHENVLKPEHRDVGG